MLAHEHLISLADKNEALLERLNYNSRYDDPFLLDNPETFLSSGLFSKDATDKIFSDAPTVEPLSESTHIYPKKLGMVLIRPDMTPINNAVEGFISSRFAITDVQDVTMTPEIYWDIYSEAIISRETRQSRFTRAAVYVNSLCRLIVFEKLDNFTPEIATSNQFIAELKGKQGVYQPDTLRGDLVYHAAIKAGFHTLDNPSVALAVDPFGAYRKIERSTSPHPSKSLLYPLLFFTGVGIHIPNYNEMQRDLALLDRSNVNNYVSNS